MKANMAEASSLPSGMIDNKVADENLNVNQFQSSGLRKPPSVNSSNNVRLKEICKNIFKLNLKLYSQVNPSVTRERLQLIQDRINQMKANQPQ